MDLARWFWLALVVACLGWYATVTAYVAVLGARDIRRMLARLAAGGSPGDAAEVRPR
jgi:hypothetical protein